MSDSRPPDLTAFYSIVRFVADPLRDEPINIGLVMASADGEWSRFAVQVPKTKLWAMNRRGDVDQIERWANLVRDQYESDGYRGLFNKAGRFDPALMREWAETFGASLRLSEPRVAVDASLDQLWDDLFASLVRGRRSYVTTSDVPNIRTLRPRTAREEQKAVIDHFLQAAMSWPTFDEGLLRRDTTFDGVRATHLADLAILNGHLTGVIQVLPIVHGSDAEVITKRALLLEAALDVAPSVVKLAIHDDPPDDRRELLEETRSVIQEYPIDRRVSLIPTRRFERLEAQLGRVLFPELGE